MEHRTIPVPPRVLRNTSPVVVWAALLVTPVVAFSILLLAQLPPSGFFVEAVASVGLGFAVALLVRNALSETDPYGGLSEIRVTDRGVDLVMPGGLSQVTWGEIDPTRVASRSGMVWLPIVQTDRYSPGWLIPVAAFTELRSDPRFPIDRLPPAFRGPGPPPWSSS